MAKKQITVRTLIAVTILGTPFEPNKLLKGSEELLKPLVESDLVSSNKADIDYCEKELGVEVFNLSDLTKSETSNDDENGDSSDSENSNQENE